MIFLNLSGREKTFAMAATPGVIYPADVASVDKENHIVTLNVSFPQNNGKDYDVKPYVFRQVQGEQGGQTHLIMTGPTGYQANLSFVRRLTSAEAAAQPTRFVVASNTTQPTVPASPQPATPPPASPQTPPPSVAATPAPVSPQPAVPAAPAVPPQNSVANQEHQEQTQGIQQQTPKGSVNPEVKKSKPRQKAKPRQERQLAESQQARPLTSCRQDTTSQERYECANKQYQAVDQKLSRAFEKRKARLPADRQKDYARAEYKWQVHKREECRTRSYAKPGGIDRRIAVLTCWAEMTRQRLASMKNAG